MAPLSGSLPGVAPNFCAFAARTTRISVSATSAILIEADRLRAEGRSLVDFGVGEPDFATPDHIKRAAMDALSRDFTKYTSVGGTAELKQAIVESHRRDFGSDYTPDEVLVTLGGKHALFNAISVLVDHGDEVILPSPYWVSFRDQITYAGGVPVIVPTDEEAGFALPVERVADAITPRTRIILLNSPSNPSGAVFSPDSVRAVLELCRRHSIWLISDECYVKFLYDDQPYSAASEEESKRWLVLAGSLSKTYAMTGWRLGYALAPKVVIQQMLNLQSHSTSNATSFVQKGGVAALLGPQDAVSAMLAEYRRRRQIMVEGLRSIPGVSCVMPSGAFYAYPNVCRLLGVDCVSTVDLSTRLLREAGVVTVPGEAFGTNAHIRLSYATSIAVIEEGLERLRGFCTALLH